MQNNIYPVKSHTLLCQGRTQSSQAVLTLTKLERILGGSTYTTRLTVPSIFFYTLWQLQGFYQCLWFSFRKAAHTVWILYFPCNPSFPIKYNIVWQIKWYSNEKHVLCFLVSSWIQWNITGFFSSSMQQKHSNMNGQQVAFKLVFINATDTLFLKVFVSKKN